MHSPLDFVLLLLGCAVCGVVLFRYLQLPSILGYLAVGVAIGPRAIGIISETSVLSELAEFGVVFLMFTVGLEFSLSQLMAMRKTVFGLGFAQVATAIGGAVILILVVAFVFPELGMSWEAGFALGGAWAMSSTAIVSKMLAERMELETEYGRRVIGVLLFQDLAIVFLMILVPTFCGDSSDMMMVLAKAAGKIVLVLLVLFLLGKRVMNRWMGIIVGRRSSELFMLNLLLITLGMAWITEFVGLSKELGAFIAGMLMAETRYKNEVEVNIKSFRDVLLGLFFITVGMMLDIRLVLQYWWLVLGLVVFCFFYKFVLAALMAKIFGSSNGVAIKIGLALAQAGEFSIVLVNQISDLKLVPSWLIQVMMASMVISMLIAPFIIMNIERLAGSFSVNDQLKQAVALTRLAMDVKNVNRHVILAGFGRTGQNVSVLLEEEEIPYRALDLDLERIRKAEAAGIKVAYADATRREALVAAGISRASALLITFASLPAVLRIIYYARELNPTIPIIVRTYDDTDFDTLKEAGASEVVPEIMECSLVMSSNAMLANGRSMPDVIKRVQATRMTRYAKLREYFHGETDNMPNYMETYWSKTVLHVPEGSAAIGKTLEQLNLPINSVEVTGVRQNGKAVDFSYDHVICEDDVIVLRGNNEGLKQAEEALFKSLDGLKIKPKEKKEEETELPADPAGTEEKPDGETSATGKS